MFCTHPFYATLSFFPAFNARWQQITQLWILIYTQSSETLGKSTLQLWEYNRQHIKKNFFFCWKWKEKLFLCHRFHDRHEKLNPHRMCVIVWILGCIYSLHFTRCWKLCQKDHVSETSLQNDTSLWCLGQVGAENKIRMKDWVFMYKFMVNRKKAEFSLVSRASWVVGDFRVRAR